ncbi:MAG: response regulator [Pseudomonadota bacterium]
MDTDSFNTSLPRPSAARPLLGMTVLVIEDSRFACEAMRLLCLRSGARIRRADSLRAARRHLQVYRPSIVVVDIGLPDGSGDDLIRTLVVANTRPQAIIGTSGDPDGEARAMTAGADGFLHKPITSLAAFQSCLLDCLPPDRQPPGPRAIAAEDVQPDPIAYHDDLAHAADVMTDDALDGSLNYVAQFLSGVAHSAADTHLEHAARQVTLKLNAGEPAEVEAATLNGLLQDRLSQRIAI